MTTIHDNDKSIFIKYQQTTMTATTSTTASTATATTPDECALFNVYNYYYCMCCARIYWTERWAPIPHIDRRHILPFNTVFFLFSFFLNNLRTDGDLNYNAIGTYVRLYGHGYICIYWYSFVCVCVCVPVV